MPIAIHRGIVRSYTAATHKADVQLVGSLPTVLTNVPVATDIARAEVVAGRECSLLLFDEHNPADAVVFTVHGAVPAAAAGADPTPIMINPGSRLSIGDHISAWGSAGPASAAWPAANRALYIPFVLAEAVTVLKLFCVNGGTVSGNLDVGIYNNAGSRLISSGSTAQAGANAIQEFDIADTVIGPGQFYLAMAVDNVTATVARWQPIGATVLAANVLRTTGMAEQASAFPLPASATLAVVSTMYIPLVGLSLRTLVA